MLNPQAVGWQRWLFVGISHYNWDFAKIPVIKIPKLRKIPNPGDKKSES